MDNYVLICTRDMRFWKSAPTVEQAEYWAELLLPNDDFVITGSNNRWYSRFTSIELKTLYQNYYQQQMPDSYDYGQQVLAVAHIASELVCDSTPLETLAERLGRPLPSTIPLPPPAPTRSPRNEGPTEYSRPKEGTATGRVWAIADALQASLGRLPTRQEVATEGQKEGINPSTASTQYGKWKGSQK